MECLIDRDGHGYYAIRLFEYLDQERISVIEPVELKYKIQGCYEPFTQPFLKINVRDFRRKDNILQAIVDAAYQMGIEPKGYTAPKQELEAIKYHLEDMRKLVFK